MDTYALVQLGKTKQGFESDRAYALANGLTVQNISDWKAGRSKPSANNFLKLAISAGMNIEQALEYSEAMERNKNFKEAGFSNIYFLPFAGASALSAMLLMNVTQLPYGALAMGILGGASVYYVK